jgi:beta-glucosidase
VLHNGSPVEMPWIGKVKAVLEAYLGGQAVGLATVRVLFGEVSPSGCLPESFPKKLEDNPSYLFYGGEGDTAEYREGIFVGYRYYDRKEMELLFPFGHGLSYTSFSFSDLRLSSGRISDRDSLTATVRVTNTGKRAGKTVVQLYVGDCESSVFRPVRELKGFEKIYLEPGEAKDVSFTLDKRSFAYWNTQIHDWHVESGEFRIEIGRSSRDIVLTEKVYVESSVTLPKHYDVNSIFMDIMKDPRAETILKPVLDGFRETFLSSGEGESDAAQEAISNEMSLAMFNYMPLRTILSFAGEKADPDLLEKILTALNS